MAGMLASDATSISSEVPVKGNPFEGVFEAVRFREGTAPAKTLREQAFQKFCELGIPSTKDEDWKYTNIQALAKVHFRPSAPSAQQLPESELSPLFVSEKSHRLVFVDGVFQPSLSRTNGLEISSETPVVAESETSSFAYLNAALAPEAKKIRVLKNQRIEELVEIVHLVTAPPVGTAADSEGLVLPVRLSIHAEENSSAKFVETFLGLGSQKYFTSVFTEVICEAGSDIEHTKLQVESKNAFHVSKLVLTQKEKSRFTSNVFSFGGGVVRNEIFPVLDGERIESFLNGLTVIDGTQHVDNSTVIDHAQPNCFSRELYKGIYGERSKGVFSGTIIVRPDAQKTNAIQSNQSVLVSENASIETRPQLKIWADDVKCTHGATVGQLDEDARFYLRSRGIPANQAQAMLLQAFAGDIVSHVSTPELRAMISSRLGQVLESLN